MHHRDGNFDERDEALSDICNLANDEVPTLKLTTPRQ